MRSPISVCRRYRKPAACKALRNSISGSVSLDRRFDSEPDAAVGIQPSDLSLDFIFEVRIGRGTTLSRLRSSFDSFVARSSKGGPLRGADSVTYPEVRGRRIHRRDIRRIGRRVDKAEADCGARKCPGMDEVEALLRCVDRIPAEVYARSGMVRVGPESRVAGHAFVPFGRGHAPHVAFPVGGVMVLGQDFGNERDLDTVFTSGEETDAVPTWREIGRALRAGDIPLHACWRTNYVMGVRRGRDSNCKGRSPGLQHGELRRACGDLFVRQVSAQRPCAIIVLGTYLPVVLAAEFPRAFGRWAARSFARRDENSGAAIRDADIGGVIVSLAVSIVHPSMRGRNVSKRRFDGYEGVQAERALLGLVRDVVHERWFPQTRARRDVRYLPTL